jgi:hypothetical protein
MRARKHTRGGKKRGERGGERETSRGRREASGRFSIPEVSVFFSYTRKSFVLVIGSFLMLVLHTCTLPLSPASLLIESTAAREGVEASSWM